MRTLFESIGVYPHTCVWEITSRCNLQCIHCASGLGPVASRGVELTTERALQLADELADLGCKYVALSGGEALLRADWPQLAGKIKSRNVDVGMISNGLLIRESVVKTMVENGVSILAISIDGLQNTHDFIRAKKGCFNAAVSALRLASAAGIRTHAITHVNRMNRGELEAMHDQLENLGVKTWLVQLSAPMGRMSERRDLILDASELRPFAEWLSATKERSRIYIAVGDNVGYYTELEPSLRRKGPDNPLPFWCGCSAGFLTIGIEANGNVKGCLSLQSEKYVEGNVLERPLREIWEAPGAFAYTRCFDPSQLHDSCKGCDYGEVCRGGCTFMSVALTGRPHGNPHCLYRLSCAT